MLLGDLLARFETPSFAGLGAFAQDAMRRFAAGATNEEWVTLLGALARASDPGAVCLTFAFKQAVETATASANAHVRSGAHG